MMSFKRFITSVERSFSLRAFNAYETEINEHFWSFKVISEYSRYIAQQFKNVDPSHLTKNAFHASGPDARRIPTTVGEWLEAREELENWLRQSALVSAAAYHEAYLRQIVRSALMSDPLIRSGSSRLLDGVMLLKKGTELNYEPEILSITRGDWQSRSASFVRLFGAPPTAAFPVSELEEIRKIRNDFAHGFGRDLNIPNPSSFSISPSQRLRHDKFLSYLKVISKSAAAIDSHLLERHIGDFEIVYIFHEWEKYLRNMPMSARQMFDIKNTYIASSIFQKAENTAKNSNITINTFRL